MLKSIKITKLFGRFDYILSFSNQQIMIITGPNGYGKSTILRIINNFCNNNFEKILTYVFSELTITCDSGCIVIEKKKNSFKINNFEFPYPSRKWDRKHSISRYLMEMDLGKFSDIRSSEKVMGRVTKQLRFGDDDFFDANFVFSILDAYDGDLSTEKLNREIEELNSAFDLIKVIQQDIGKVHFIQEQRLIEKREIPDEERRYSQPKTEYVTVINENSEKLKAELAEIMKRHSTISSNLDSSYIKRLFEADSVGITYSDIVKQLEFLQKRQDKLQKYGLAEIQNASYLNQLNQDKLKRFDVELSIYLEDANAKYKVFEPIVKNRWYCS